MRSDKHRKKKNQINEDFLAEYRNMESGNTEEYRQEPMSKKEAKKLKKEQKKYNKKGKKKRTWLKVLIVLILLIGVGVAAAATFADSQIKKLNHTDTSSVDLGIDKNTAKNLEGYTNIALLGVDARKGELIENCRTDAIIVVTINDKTGEITLTSVARDTYLLMESSYGDEMLDKATHAHAFGGPVNTVRMLNKSLDLNIENYAVLNWNSVVDLVNAVGGITVDVKANEIRDLNKWGPETAANTDQTWTPITNTGVQEIDGAQAATYCRIRKTSGGDNGRTERMKKVVNSIFKEVKSNPTLITKVTDEVFPQITTNMTTTDII
ncbi:MAG: LCP family protein, partial [Eubacterium sp.]|nr:LCP family protein [Eubacterium sp.]